MLRRSLLARLVDRGVLAMRQRCRAVGDDQRVELDEAVALLLVVRGDLGPRNDLVAGARGRQQLHAAADVDPRAQNGIVDEDAIHHALDQAGMAEPLAREDRIGFPDIGEIVRGGLPDPSARLCAKPFAGLERRRADRLALSDRGDREIVAQIHRRRSRRQRGRPGGAELGTAEHLDREQAIVLGRIDIGRLAVIDRLDEAGLHQSAGEEIAAPARQRHMHHVGEDVDAGHQPAREAEAARHLVVMHLVLGLFGGVVGLDAVGFEPVRHGWPSPKFLLFRIDRRPRGTPVNPLAFAARMGYHPAND
ncbi:hypothetical protein DXU04_34435 [Bradyrhizobium diazoefficiens]